MRLHEFDPRDIEHDRYGKIDGNTCAERGDSYGRKSYEVSMSEEDPTGDASAWDQGPRLLQLIDAEQGGRMGLGNSCGGTVSHS